jgi:hypothetical protein
VADIGLIGNFMSYSEQHLKETAEVVSKLNPGDCENAAGACSSSESAAARPTPPTP